MMIEHEYQATLNGPLMYNDGDTMTKSLNMLNIVLDFQTTSVTNDE